MNPTGLIIFIVIFLIDSLIKAQRRAQQQGGEWQEVLRRRTPTPAERGPGSRGTRQAPPRRGRPAAPPGEARAVSTGSAPDAEEQYDDYGGSMQFISGEGVSYEWTDAALADEASDAIDGGTPSGGLRAEHSAASGEATRAALAMLTGRTTPSGPATAIALAEIVGKPRAHMPWRPRGMRGGATLRSRPD